MISYITGASGFIGARLIKLLPETTIPIPHGHIQRAEYGTCDTIYFLSAYGNMAYQSDMHRILEANVRDLTHVVCRSIPKLFVYFSSSSVLLPVKTPYSLTKRAGEMIVQASGREHVIIRPFSVIGVGEQKDHLIPALIRSCLDGVRMDLVPHATHDFIDIEDVVSGVMSVCNSSIRGTVELGTGIPKTNEEILSIVERVTGRKADVRIVQSMRPYDHEEWYCRGLDKLKGVWAPMKTVEQSIREMVAAYESSKETNS